ncbi:MAG: hypothetical protein AAF249_07785 [Pseudomonadota bacterium]
MQPFTLRLVVGCDPTIGRFPHRVSVNDNLSKEQERFERIVSRELVEDLARDKGD